MSKIKTLFLDIGGVLLTDGWNTDSREAAYEHFNIEKEDIEKRHGMFFDSYELGKLKLEDYMKYVIFFEKRSFSRQDFIEFMYSRSVVLPGAIEFFVELKKKHQVKVVALSNEPRELNDYRIKKFNLNQLYDAYISSSYVQMRKPDPDMYRMAFDVAQTTKEETIYIDDRLPYIEFATGMGIRSLHYQGVEMANNFFDKEFNK